jgi:hypothetical protein
MASPSAIRSRRIIRSIICVQPSALRSENAPLSQVIAPKSGIVTSRQSASGARPGSSRVRRPATAHWV